MLHIEQFRFGDNFAYLIFGPTEAMAVDGGAWQEILNFLKQYQLRLKYVTNTHSHYDHTPGDDHLLHRTTATFLDCKAFSDGDIIKIDANPVSVYKTPGHSLDSVCFHAGRNLITGDTLFNGTIGNCFSGDLKGFFESIQKLMGLPDDMLIFAGHDYINDSLAYARHLDPGNPDIERYRQNHDPGLVYSTLADEKKINPYLRFNEEPFVSLIQKRGLPHATEWERWQSLMSIE